MSMSVSFAPQLLNMGNISTSKELTTTGAKYTSEPVAFIFDEVDEKFLSTEETKKKAETESQEKQWGFKWGPKIDQVWTAETHPIRVLKEAEEERKKGTEIERHLQSAMDALCRETEILRRQLRVLMEAVEERKKRTKTEHRFQSEKDLFWRGNELRRRMEEKRERTEEEMKFGWGTKTELKWSMEEASRIRQMVLKDRVDKEGNDISMKILVFGPTGHGKSSFCNSCRLALKGCDRPTSFTSVSSSFTTGSHGNKLIINTPGMFDSNRISSTHIEDIASGKVPFYADITNTLEMKENSNMVIPPADKNDVAIIVLRYDTELGIELKRQIGVILELVGNGVISSYHVVLTHLDECDPQFKNTDKIPNLYHSPKVQEAVKRMSSQTGIPSYAISFVKNYTYESQTDVNTSLLHLRVLERVIHSTIEQREIRMQMKQLGEFLEDSTREKIYRWGQKTTIDWTIEGLERLRHEIQKPNDFMDSMVISVRGSQRSELFSFTQRLRSIFTNSTKSDLKEAFLIRDIHESTDNDFPFYANITSTMNEDDRIMEHHGVRGMNDVSCVVLLLKYETEITPQLRRKLKLIMTRAGKGELTYHLVLTHLEECDPQFKDDKNLPNIYESDMVQEAVNEMSKETGIPPYAISFVNSYEHGTEINTNTAILHLKIFQRVIRSALDQEEKKLDKELQMELVYQATEI